MNKKSKISEDVIIIVPPVTELRRPSLAAHILQAWGGKNGFNVKIFYSNIALAAEIGELNYRGISLGKLSDIIGERFFARIAYGMNTFNKTEYNDSYSHVPYYNHMSDVKKSFQYIKEFEQEKLASWIDRYIKEIIKLKPKIVGCTSSFETTNASISFFNKIKELEPEIITIFGGANCESEMAEGILTLSKNIDYIFNGESDITFPKFVKDILQGVYYPNKIIEEIRCENLDLIPMIDYSDYYQQLKQYLPRSSIWDTYDIQLPYETSRGCWWGVKNKCLFCGLNANKLSYREKNPDKVIRELQVLIKSHPSSKVGFFDNIVPNSYFKTFFPRLKESIPNITFGAEVKTNLSLEQLVVLKNAGLGQLQPGIEALSSSLLKRMNKGVLCRHNIAFLRNCTSLNILLCWNLLYGFPGDVEEDYIETYNILKLIKHFMPPMSMPLVIIERFSKYFNEMEKYNIKKIIPFPAYYECFPEFADISKLAYHFLGEYESFGKNNTELMDKIIGLVKEWQISWFSGNSLKLEINKISNNKFMLLDTRKVNLLNDVQIIDRKQAIACLKNRPINHELNADMVQETKFALDNKWIVEMDSWYVSLINSSEELLFEFENLVKFDEKQE
jgi:ribosomal peptide maturation radical SAM protein 1